ncbi:MAG: ABATE domain-containing protein [Thermomicrobiales bacterium]
MSQPAATSSQRQGLQAGFPRLLGERLCLDFANSVESPLTEPQEFLTGFGGLARWGRHVGLLDEAEVMALLGAARFRPGAAEALFADALRLRAAVQAVFAAIAAGAAPVADELAVIQQAYAQSLPRTRLTLREGRADWAWAATGGLAAAEMVLWQVARSAVDLLTGDDLARVKACDCCWLFYDTSRNGSRRWCSMEGCGTEAKMRRYTEKRRAARA